MKILHIGKYFSPFKGGIENMMLALIQQQVSLGLSVSALVHHHEPARKFSVSKEFGASIYRIPILGKLLFVPLAITGFCHMRALLKTRRFDVIHAHLPNVTCFWLLLLPRSEYKKLVLHWHSDVIGAAPNLGIKLLYPVYRIWEKAMLRRADSIIVTSNNYLETSEPLRNFHHKCVVIPLGLDNIADNSVTSTIDVKSPDGEVSAKNVGVLCVGRLTYYKGHEFLIRAMSLLQNGHVTLSLVGIGEEESRLRALTEKLGIASKVNFLGQVDDMELNSLVKHCDFLILASIERTEAFGLVLLEAMRAGKACICTDVEGSGMSNVVLHGETGLVVKHADENALADAISALAANEKLREMYGANGRERFLSTYLIDQVERSIYQTYSRD